MPELDDSDEIDLDEVRDRLSAHEIPPDIADKFAVLLQSLNFEYCLRTTLDQFGPEAADEDVSMALLLRWARLHGYLTDPDLTDADVEELRQELVNFMNSTDVEELHEELASLLNCAHAHFPVPPRNARHFTWLALVGFRRWSTGAWAELRSRLYSLRAPRSLPRPLLVARRPTMRRRRSPATQRGPPAASDEDDPEPSPSRRLPALVVA